MMTEAFSQNVGKFTFPAQVVYRYLPLIISQKQIGQYTLCQIYKVAQKQPVDTGWLSSFMT